jgi:predicted RNase H-like HicB family nuclease
MAKFTAVLEQGEDGSWSAYTLTPTVASGVWDTKEEALEDLKAGMVLWLDYMKETGQPVPVSSIEVVTFEVAA